MSRKIAVCLLVALFFAATTVAPAQPATPGFFDDVVQVSSPDTQTGDPDGLRGGHPSAPGEMIQTLFGRLMNLLLF